MDFKPFRNSVKSKHDAIGLKALDIQVQGLNPAMPAGQQADRSRMGSTPLFQDKNFAPTPANLPAEIRTKYRCF
jgi:hypothetical protein